MSSLEEPPAKKMKMGTTLTYWNGRGLCESIRFMLAFTGEKYEEAVPGFEGVKHLSEPSHMQKVREDGLLVWNQVPLLCIDGLNLVQSKAVVRYLAEKHNVRGTCPAEVAMCDMIAEGIADWKTAIGHPFEFGFGAHAQTDENKTKNVAGNGRYLPMVERCLAKNNPNGSVGGGFLVGSSATYCDVLALEVLDQIVRADDQCLAEFPLTSSLYKTMAAKMKDFLSSDMRKSKVQDTIEGYKKTVMHTLGW